MLFAEAPVFPVSVDRICQNSLRIVPETRFVFLCTCDQCDALVEVVKALRVNEGVAVYHRKPELLPKLHRMPGFAPDDWTHMGLAQVDDPVGNGGLGILQMRSLLLGHTAERSQSLPLAMFQHVLRQGCKQIVQIGESALHVIQLL